MAKISNIKKNSYSYRAGLRLNDDVVEINDISNLDFIDLALLEELEFFNIKVIRDNVLLNLNIKKPIYSKLDFSIDLNLDIRECKNRCLFCFVEQLPCGMRDSLYVKDDDYRLSFAFGSYITLTNLTYVDIDRIIKLKISPLYISFHAYDSKIRRKLLGNINADKTLEYIKILHQNKIYMNMQIVLVEGINSHNVLRESLSFLESLQPYVKSVAIVPVGITKHREKLFTLNTLSKDCAIDCIKIAQEFYNKNDGFVWCSDEMYILAESCNIPNDEYYKNYDQIENGVGLIRTFENELNIAIDDYYYEINLKENALENNIKNNEKLMRKTHEFRYENNTKNCSEIHIKTDDIYCENSSNKSLKKASIINLIKGVSFYPFLKNYAKKIEEILNKKINVFEIKNSFFGETITVAGLLTGEDIFNQLNQMKFDGDIIIPKNMLREFTDTFLDGMKVSELEKKLNKKIHVSVGGEDLFKIIKNN